MDQQTQLTQVFTDLKQSGILVSAPEGVAMVTPKSAQISAEDNITLTAKENTDISVVEDFRIAAGNALSLFTSHDEMKLIANQGRISIQAQHNQLDVIAQNELKILSTQDKITIAGEKALLLTSGGAYIRFQNGDIEIHAPGKIDIKGASMNMGEPAQMDYTMPTFERAPICIECLRAAAEKGAGMMAVS